eukprot:256517-Chlamydomonas_euryale.AAC.7
MAVARRRRVATSRRRRGRKRCRRNGRRRCVGTGKRASRVLAADRPGRRVGQVLAVGVYLRRHVIRAAAADRRAVATAVHRHKFAQPQQTLHEA